MLESWRLREEWRVPVLVAIGLFLLYAWCAPRTIALEDDGLFVMASYFNGIAHPPGYPVFTLIGHLFSQLPFGSVAWRVHLVSALFGGLTCAVIWCIGRSLVPSPAIAAAAALAYGLSEAFWSQAIIAEVYTLNTFITFMVVLLLLRLAQWRDDEQSGQAPAVSWCAAFWLGLAYGLGLSNHWPLLVLFSPAFLLLGWPALGSLARRAPALLVGLAIGLLPYLWLYLRSQMDPEISFAGSIDGWKSFYEYVSRSTYSEADHEPGVGWNDRVGYMRFQLSELLSQMTPFGAVLGLVGLFANDRKARIYLALIIGSLGTTFLLIMLLDREYSQLGLHAYRVYPLPAYGVLALLAARGANLLLKKNDSLNLFGRREVAQWGLLIAMTGLPLLAHATKNYRGDYEWAEAYAKAALDQIPRNGALLLYADSDAFPIGYVRLVLGYRDDVTIHSGSGLIFKSRAFNPWLASDKLVKERKIKDLIESSASQVCFTGISNDYGGDYGLIWKGMVSCYDKQRLGTFDYVDRTAIEQFTQVQSVISEDPWTVMAADILDRNMVTVLLTKLSMTSGDASAYLASIIDRARDGFLGEITFLKHTLSRGDLLDANTALQILENAWRKKTRIYTKNHMIEYYGLKARILKSGGHDRLAEEAIKEAVFLKPSWKNRVLPDYLSRLFAEDRADEIIYVASLDQELDVLNEMYKLFLENRSDPGFALRATVDGVQLTVHRDGRFEVR